MVSYSEKIILSEESMNAMHTSDNASKHLESILLGSKVLYTLMLDYEYGKGNLQNVALIEDSLIASTDSTGTFKLSYDINEFSVCAALDYTGAYTMVVNYKLNLDAGELVLTGEDRYE
jgi:hypothetical protein